MSDPSFTTTVTVNRAPEDVFDAIVRPREWWSPSITGSARTGYIQRSLQKFLTTGTGQPGAD